MKISGTLLAPASKSYLQRAMVIALLTNGKTVLHNVSWCDDTIAVKNLIQQLGAKVSEVSNQVIINVTKLQFDKDSYNVDESGLAIRMFSPILGLADKKVILTGKDSLLKRPVDFVQQALAQLGVEVTSVAGLPPLIIKGPLTSGNLVIDASVSSQLLSGLLITLPLVKGKTEIIVESLNSKPYIDMTLEIISHFGVHVINENYQKFIIDGNKQYYPCEYLIEGDWSGAAFHLVAGAIGGNVEVLNLNKDSKQADKAIVNAIIRAGAEVEIKTNSVIVNKKKLSAFEFDATHCPDLFPPLAALAANCAGTSVIKGTTRLAHKESNRAMVLKNELSKLGIKIKSDGDVMKITGGKITSGTIYPNNDHRIAMLGGVLNIVSDGKIKIINKEVINKSYPDFFKDLESITQ